MVDTISFGVHIEIYLCKQFSELEPTLCMELQTMRFFAAPATLLTRPVCIFMSFVEEKDKCQSDSKSEKVKILGLFGVYFSFQNNLCFSPPCSSYFSMIFK